MKVKMYICLCLFLSFGLSANKAMAQYSFINKTLEYAGCDSLFYRLGINTYVTPTAYDSLTVETSFGDGNTSTVLALSGTPRAYVGHNYTEPGVYTVKSYLLYNGLVEDSIVFSDTVNLCTSLHVVSFVDHNGDCVYDAGDSYLPNPYTLEVDSAGVPVDTITSTSFYYAGGGTGTIYTFRVLTLPAGYMLSCPADSVVFDTVAGTSPGAWYASIGFVCDTTGFDLHVWGWFSPGLTGACSHVYAYEYGCGTVPGATLTINYSIKYAYASNTLGVAPTASGAGFVTFALGSLSPDSVVSFNVFYTAVGTPTLGDTTNTTWTLDPIAGDMVPANNVHAETDTIRSSYDPNEKSVSPQGLIAAGTQLQYAISFENTGNDTAFNIHVQDTLSADLDVNTFRLVSASAAVTTEVATTATGRSVIKFDFANIHLLDASHPGNNTGMVLFDISAKSGLPLGTVINNEAGIYFDYNPVVMTNSTMNIIGTPESVATLTNAAGINIYPNPVTDILNINVTKGNFSDLTILNNVGETVMHTQMTGAHAAINISTLPAGMYYVRVHGENGVQVQKFVKE